MLKLSKSSLLLFLCTSLSGEIFLPLLIKDAKSWGYGNPRLVLISGPTAVSTNPNRIRSKDGLSIYGSHGFWFLGMRKEQVALSQRISSIDFGVSIDYFDYGEFEQYPEYPSGEPIGVFPAFDFVLVSGLSIGIPRGRFGLGVSYLHETIYDESYNSYCVDFVLDYSPFKDFNFVIGLEDFNPGVRRDTFTYYPPVTLGSGADYRLGSINIGGEVGYLLHSEDWMGSFGVSVVRQPLVFRGGIFYLDKVVPTVGLGVLTEMIHVDLGLVFHPYDLGMTKHIGVGVNF